MLLFIRDCDGRGIVQQYPASHKMRNKQVLHYGYLCANACAVPGLLQDARQRAAHYPLRPLR